MASCGDKSKRKASLLGIGTTIISQSMMAALLFSPGENVIKPGSEVEVSDRLFKAAFIWFYV